MPRARLHFTPRAVGADPRSRSGRVRIHIALEIRGQQNAPFRVGKLDVVEDRHARTSVQAGPQAHRGRLWMHAERVALFLPIVRAGDLAQVAPLWQTPVRRDLIHRKERHARPGHVGCL